MKSIYILVGDGPLVFKCYNQIQTLKGGIEELHVRPKNLIILDCI